MSTLARRDRILILGASGMLGSAAYRLLSADERCDVFGTVRTPTAEGFPLAALRGQLFFGVDVLETGRLADLLREVRPHVVLNCVGLVKQLAQSGDPLLAIPLNALFPHQLAALCGDHGARLVHISTDCVFDGTKGNYREVDRPDADDLYGRTKLLGEVDYPNAVTLRTSIIGHELAGSRSLVDWFLSQHGTVRGYSRAIFSGLPTVELVRVIRDHVMPNPALRGLYHVSAAPISKLELLRLVASIYSKGVDIVPADDVAIDRSLDSARFRSVTGYIPADWPSLVQAMKDFG